MAIDASGTTGASERMDPAVTDADEKLTSSRLGDRLRTLIVWAGIVTLAALSVLATGHLVADIVPVLDIRGGRTEVALRLAPVALLALGGLGLALLLVWLAGRRRRLELVAIGIGAIVLVGVRVYLAAQFDSGTLGEPAVYRTMGESIVSGELEFLDRPMGYGAALAAAFAFIADRQLAIESVNLLLSLLSGGVVLGLARGLYGARAGVLAFLAYALWPAAALMTVVSIPQIAFDLAVVGAAWAAVGMPPGWRGGAVTGAILGLAQYLRPTAPYILPAFILARLWPGGERRTLALAVLVPVVAFLIVLIPVVAYNLERTGALSIATSDFGGHTLYIGTDIRSGGRFSEEADRALIELAGPDPLARSEMGARIAFERIRDDPVGIALLAVRKQDTLWGTEHYGVQYAIAQRFADRPEHPAATAPLLLSQGFYALILIAATVGVVLRRHERDALVPLAASMIWTVSALHALLEVRDRHHAYVVPLLLPLAAFAMLAVLDRLGRGLRRLRGR